MLTYVIAILIGFLGLVLFHVYLHYNNVGRHVNNLKGPPSLPVIGNLLNLAVSLVQLNELLIKWGKEYYPLYRVWVGSRAVIIIHHPDDLEILLSSTRHINKEYTYEYFRPWMKNGLLISNGKKWHQRRKILTPAFHFNILKKYIDITNEQSEKFIQNTRTAGKEVIQELVPFVSEHTLNIISESAMGVALDNENGLAAANKYKDAVYRMGSMIIYRAVRPYIQDWMLPFLPKLNKEKNDIVNNLDDFTDKIVRERREYHKSTGYKYVDDLNKDEAVEAEDLYTGKKKRLAMLDLLLKLEREGLIDDFGIKEEVSTFVFEGHDTTAMGLCFAIMILAENKEVQARARKEIEEIMNQKDGKLETSDLQKLNYLERCIKESLRLYPSVPMITRYITEDLQLKHAFLPKGINVSIRIFDTHRDPEFWPEPEKFDPDRFLPDRINARHPFSYVPFSAGPRNCIGQKFAMMELKSLMARILYNFYLEPVDYIRDIKLVTDIVLRTDKPIKTKFIQIDRR